MAENEILTHKQYRFFCILLLSCLFVWTGFCIFSGEKIPVGKGFGWDGTIYANAVKYMNGTNETEFTAMSSHAQRLFPSAIVFAGMKAFGSEFSNQNIIRAFAILNFILLSISVFLFFKISEFHKLSKSLTLLGLIGLFFSFSVLKMNSYYPVLTDTMAFTLGMLAVYAFFSERFSLYLLTLLSVSFTWPIAALTLPLLGIWGRNPITIKFIETDLLKKRIVVTALIPFSAFVCYYIYAHKFVIETGAIYHEITGNPFLFFTILSLGCILLAFTFYHQYKLAWDIDWFRTPIELLKNIKPFSLILTAGLVILIRIFLATLSQKNLGVSPVFYVLNIIRGSVLQPGSILIHHVLYFGPVLFFTFYHWKKVCEIVARHGAGLILFFISSLIFAIDPEVRHDVFFMPFLITVTLITLKEKAFAPGQPFLIFFLFLSLFASKVWLPINTPEFVESIIHDQVLSVPVQQRYFMSMGGLSTDYYHFFLQAILVLISGLIFYLYYRSSIKKISERGRILPGKP